MKIDGFRVNLGELSTGENLNSKVTKQDISKLLDEARKSPDFLKDKGSYEFRLRKQKGESKQKNSVVLELRRPTTSRFSKIFSMFTNSRRSKERSDAYDAIRQHMNGLSERKAGAVRKQDARQLAGKVLTLDDLVRGDAAERKLYGLSLSRETLKKNLSAVLERGLEDSISEDTRSTGLEVRKQTMSFLNRASVSINEHGRLVIKSPSESGNGQKNLDAVINFLSDKCKPLGGESLRLDAPGDMRLKNLAESVLLHIRSGSDQAISRPIDETLTEQTDVKMYAKMKAIEFQVEANDMDVRVNLLESGGLFIGDIAVPDKTVDFGAKLEFKMSVDTLMKGLSKADNPDIYKEVDFHIASHLSKTSKTRLEELDELRLETRKAAEKKSDEERAQRELDAQRREINQGPRQSPFGEH